MSLNRESRTSWLIVAIGLALLALSIWQIGRVRPPGSFRIVTGPEGSQSHRMAQSFVEPVAERGFRLEIVPTRGSGQVAEAMQQSEAEAGFLENTFSLQNDLTGIQALTAVYPEPLWIFYPAEADEEETYDALSDLTGRISIGEANSGSNEIARLLFQLSEVGPDQISLVSLPDDVAAEQLLSGELDAVLIAGGINSDPVLQLLTSPEIDILNLRRIDALTILAPFLDSVVVPAGIVRLSQDRPDEDKNLLSTQAVLVTREDLHPDLQRLLLTVAELEHQPHRWFEATDQYPTTDNILLDISPVALEFYQGSVTYLERYLPFWIASPLERFYLLILPVLLLLYPVVRSSPSLYSGVMRRRINRWYKIVRDVELGLEDYSMEQVDEQITRLTQMNAQLARTINVPTGYMERYYNLRLHIRLVLDELRDRRTELLDEAENEA
jgi:uncharacterized protein